MTHVTLAQVLQPALKRGYAVPGLVCLGWEDMRAYVAAAEAEHAPIILQAGPGCRTHTPLPILGGQSQRSLKQYFQPTHAAQLHTIPGIMDMVAKFK